MTKHETKIKAREDLNLAIVNESYAWRKYASVEQGSSPDGGQVNRGMPRPTRMAMEHALAREAAAVTKAAVDALVAACEEATRAGIADWIAAAPSRMEAQSAAGAQSLHYMHTIGQLAAAASLADAIRNKADLGEQGT